MQKLFLLCLTLFSLQSFAQETEKTLVKSFDPEGSEIIKVEFTDQVTTDIWDENVLQVELDIHVNTSAAILSQLIKVGRYSIEGSKEENTYYLRLPALQKDVVIRGNKLTENIQASIKTPGYMVVESGAVHKDIAMLDQKMGGAAARSTQADKLKLFTKNIELHIRFKATGEDVDPSEVMVGDTPLTELMTDAK